MNEEAQNLVIGGRFRLDAQLGAGGMAQVFRAWDLARNRAVAVKLLKPDIASNEEAVERMRREGEALSRLKHPCIVAIETFGKLPDGRMFLAMELLEGETLGERMRRHTMNPGELAPVVRDVASGLTAAHQAHIVHRDLKPDNIFLCGPGPNQPPAVKILDFGISKIYGYDRLTRTGQILGTPRYMAPEQLSADRSLDGRVDVYAMGVILYEALAGHPPFWGTNPSELVINILHGNSAPLKSYRADLADDIVAVVSRAMARVREARFPNVGALSEAWGAAATAGVAASSQVRDRSQMRTSVLGGVDSDAPPRPLWEQPQDLSPGTFGNSGAPPQSAADQGSDGNDGETRPSFKPLPPTASPAASSSSSVDSSEVLPPHEPLKLPIRTRGLWILAALLIAAASAGVVIAALQFFGGSRS